MGEVDIAVAWSELEISIASLAGYAMRKGDAALVLLVLETSRDLVRVKEALNEIAILRKESTD